MACHPPEEVETVPEKAKELEKELKHFRIPEVTGTDDSSRQDACIGSKTGCAIYWNGEMQTCISLNGRHNVNPFEIGFEAAWARLKAEEQETFHRPKACQVCEMAGDCQHNCAGRRFEGTGSSHEPDPYTCQYTYLLRIYRERQKVADIAQSPECV